MKKKIIAIMLLVTMSASVFAGCGTKAPVTSTTESGVEAAVTSEPQEEQTDVVSEQTIEKNEDTKEVVVETIDPKTQVLASIVGEWEGEFMNGERPAKAHLQVKPDGEYYVKLVFGANGWIHSYYSGTVEVVDMEDYCIVSFTVKDSDDGNFSSLDSIGDYYVDAVRKNEYGFNGMYLTQVNNGDSIFSRYFNDVRPVLYEYVDPYSEESGAKKYEVVSPSEEYYYRGNEIPKRTFALSQESIKANNVTDTEEWHAELNETQPDYYWMDDNYLYCKSNVRNYEYTQLDVYDNSTDNGEAPLLYSFDMNDFHQTGEYRDETGYTFYSQGIKYALIKDDVLYICTGHRTYASGNPQTGYITAIDIKTGEVIWKTRQQVCNASSFAFVDDTIVCGYGFTDEPDFLYVVDTTTGEVTDTYDVKNAVEYVVNKGDKLYVRCYSYNYVFDIVR